MEHVDAIKARAEEMRKKLREIDKLAGLGGQQRGVARVMLTTLQRPDCVSAWFTDPKLKPSWKGRRFRFLLKRPDRQDLWDEYVQLRQINLQAVDATGKATDEFARGAHAFYLANREAMEAGAEVGEGPASGWRGGDGGLSVESVQGEGASSCTVGQGQLVCRGR